MFSTGTIDAQVSSLRQQIQATESQLDSLKAQLAQAEEAQLQAANAGRLEPEWQQEIWGALNDPRNAHHQQQRQEQQQRFALSNEEYKRYGRQLIMPQVGLQGQLRLRSARVLVVGAGGLGCPAAAYLAGAGVGTLGLIDGDVVEVSNLHRQILHNTDRINVPKVDSAITYLRSLNPTLNYIAHRKHLRPQDAVEIFKGYDLVLDCTDHPTSRYLISDTCVLAGKPLVSASALRTEGQLTVLNNPPRPQGDETGGPCYRCVFPRPPPPDSVTSCGEGGILGPVVGTMGLLQALEAIKLLVQDPSLQTPHQPSLLLFSAYSTPQFRTVRLRSRRKDCAACSSSTSITTESLSSGSLDYIAFCGVTNPVSLLPSEQRVSASNLATLLNPHNDEQPLVVDVRDATQFSLCSLPGSVNIPWQGFQQSLKENGDEVREKLRGRDVVVVCRLGNDSQMAVKGFEEFWGGTGEVASMKDLEGGFRAWREDVEPDWPDY